MALHTPRLRPLGVGDLLDEMIRLYRTHFALLAGIAAVVMVPLLLISEVVQLILGFDGRITAEMSPSILITWGLFVVLWGLVYFVGTMAVNLAITRAVSETYLGHAPTVGSAYSGGLQRLGAAIGLSLLMSVLVGLMAITVIGIPFAIYFGICWVLAFQALLLERLGIRASLSRSRALVRGYWWRVLGIAILLGIIGWIVSMVFDIPSTIVGGMTGLSGAGFTAAPSTSVRLIGSAFAIAGSVLVTPLWFCGAVLLYYDLRVRKEGFDLELMANEMGSAPETGPSGG